MTLETRTDGRTYVSTEPGRWTTAADEHRAKYITLLEDIIATGDDAPSVLDSLTAPAENLPYNPAIPSRSARQRPELTATERRRLTRSLLQSLCDRGEPLTVDPEHLAMLRTLIPNARQLFRSHIERGEPLVLDQEHLAMLLLLIPNGRARMRGERLQREQAETVTTWLRGQERRPTVDSVVAEFESRFTLSRGRAAQLIRAIFGAA